MQGGLTSYHFDYTCGGCGWHKTLQFSADDQGRPPAPADVPFTMPCQRPSCSGTLRRS